MVRSVDVKAVDDIEKVHFENAFNGPLRTTFISSGAIL